VIWYHRLLFSPSFLTLPLKFSVLDTEVFVGFHEQIGA